jgi:glycerol-3-phosphate acyltransferase PlsY
MTDNIYFQIPYIIAGYLLGSITFGIIVEKVVSRGQKKLGKIDVPGASGVYRQYGLGPSVLTFLLDALKGAVVASTGRILDLDVIVVAIACTAVITGHSWPAWFKFRGGVGLSTTCGIALVLVPEALGASLIACVVACLIYIIFIVRYMKAKVNVVFMSLASFFLPLFVWNYHRPVAYILLFTAAFLIIVIKGLLSKTEFPAA